MNLGEKIKIAPLITLIDGNRFKYLMKEIREFTTGQIIDAEILGINKVDLIDNVQLSDLEASVQQLNSKAKVILLSGKENDERFEDFMKLLLPGISEIPNQEIPQKKSRY